MLFQEVSGSMQLVNKSNSESDKQCCDFIHVVALPGVTTIGIQMYQKYLLVKPTSNLTSGFNLK